VPGGHQYSDAAARLTYAPILTEEALLHIGGSFRYQKPNDATAVSDDRVLQPGGTLIMDSNIVGDTLLGTQPLTCWSSASAQLIGTNCVNSMIDYGAEFVASYGPFSVQGEYRGMHYDRNASIILWQQAPGNTNVNFSGWYVYATWYLTGESRAAAYQTYPKEFNQPSGFGQIRILNPWSAGGWGAWEVAARVDEINFNSGGFLVSNIAAGFNNPPNIRNIQGGRETNLTFGLNWYPDKGVRFMANWVSVVQYAAPYNRQDINGIHPNAFIMRAQVDW
jgi:phosphate-selective porin OprO/OprP